jgi:hypothetical protein
VVVDLDGVEEVEADSAPGPAAMEPDVLEMRALSPAPSAPAAAGWSLVAVSPLL